MFLNLNVGTNFIMPARWPIGKSRHAILLLYIPAISRYTVYSFDILKSPQKRFVIARTGLILILCE